MRRLGLGLLVCCALAYASVAQGIGWNQNAHYALVRALAHGTPIVDAYRGETGDLTEYHGHSYSTKAPGLAFATLPLYVVLDKTGALRASTHIPGARDPEVAALWALGLIGAVLPAMLILLLVRRLGDEWEPGYGAAAAVTIGLGSLVLPFATLFFDHVLSAALGFAAFAVARLRRELAWLAGLLAGLAIVAEYPLLLVAVAVGVYVASRGRFRGALHYFGGAAVGILPLVAYNWWAFGSPTHLSYSGGANSSGLFGVGWPSLHTAVALLFSHIGLLTLAPVCALGVVGWLLLWRLGARAEAAVALGLALAFLIYNSGYYDPFGGFSPGPRFLIPILPFLGVGLAPAYRRLPLTTLALGLASIVLMVAVTISAPVLAHDGRWFERITNGHFLGHGWPQIAPLVLLAGAALVLAVRTTPPPTVTVRDATGAGVAFAGWLTLAVLGHRLLDEWSRFASAAVVILAALTVAAAVALVQKREERPA